MNAEECKEFEEIKEAHSVDYNFTVENWRDKQIRDPRKDERWLLARLEAEAQEVKRLHIIAFKPGLTEQQQDPCWWKRADAAEARCAALEGQVREVLKIVNNKQVLALGELREVGYVYNNTNDPMQRLVFALYTDLVELSQEARAALATAPGEPQSIEIFPTQHGFIRRAESPAKEGA